MSNPVGLPTYPIGIEAPRYYTIIDAITNAQGEATDLITPDEGSVTVSGITDAGPDSNNFVLGGTTSIQVFLSGYATREGVPVEYPVYATSALVQATDLNEKDDNGNELYSWSATLPTAGLAPGLYALQSFVQTLGFDPDGGAVGYVYEADDATVTAVDAEFASVTYAPQEGTEIVSVGTAQSDTVVSVNTGFSFTYSIPSVVQLSTDGRYAVWTNGDQYEEDLQTGATIDLTTTGGSPPALAVTHNPTVIQSGTQDPYGSPDANDYGYLTYPTFTAGGVTFGAIPDFEYDPWSGLQNPLPTVTDSSGDTAVLEPFGTTPTLVGFAAAASDNGNAVLIAQPSSADPHYNVVYRSPAPTLTLDPVNGIDQFAPGAKSVTLTGTSDAIGQVVEIDFGKAGAAVGTATVQPDGSWSYSFDASGITGTSLFIEASVSSAQGTPARASETATIMQTTVTSITDSFPNGNLVNRLSPTLVPGATLTIYVNTSAPVTVTGTPTLTLSNGEAATYSGGSGTQTLTFTYVPGIIDPGSADLSVTGLNLPTGADIVDAAGSMLAGSFTQQLGLAVQTVPIILSPDNDAISTSATPLITVVAESGETVTIYDDGTAVGTGSIEQVPEPGLSEIEITPTTKLPEGQSVLSASATDASGRSSGTRSPSRWTPFRRPRRSPALPSTAMTISPWPTRRISRSR